MAWLIDILSVSCQSQITLVPCQGANSLVYDLLTDQGVVSSRAVPIYCDLLRLSFDWVALFTSKLFDLLMGRLSGAGGVCPDQARRLKNFFLSPGLGFHWLLSLSLNRF